MQTYSDMKLTCDAFPCSHTSYNFVIHILNQLIYNKVTIFPLELTT